jgi:hypothetical protein
MRCVLFAPPPGASADDEAAAVDCALFTLRTHARNVKPLSSACSALHTLCESGADGVARSALLARAAAGGAAALLAAAETTLRAAGMLQEPLYAAEVAKLRRIFPVGGAAGSFNADAAVAAPPRPLPMGFPLLPRPPRACDACGCTPTSALKRCAACRRVRYCGVTCQRAHWPQHRQSCKALAAAAGDDSGGDD